MGIESDQEIIQLVGQDQAYASLLTPTLEECRRLQLYTEQHALEWLGAHLYLFQSSIKLSPLASIRGTPESTQTSLPVDLHMQQTDDCKQAKPMRQMPLSGASAM